MDKACTHMWEKKTDNRLDDVCFKCGINLGYHIRRFCEEIGVPFEEVASAIENRKAPGA